VERTLHDLGDPVAGRPCDLHVTYSQHRCARCGVHFNADMGDLALPKCHYTRRVVALAVRLVVEDQRGSPLGCLEIWGSARFHVRKSAIRIIIGRLKPAIATLRTQTCSHTVKKTTYCLAAVLGPRLNPEVLRP
jgi:hypothetical protein